MDNTHISNLTRVDAGKDSSWHIHKDHLKYGSIQQTRVDFNGRSLKKIMEKIADNAPINAPYLKSEEQKHYYEECLTWIENNYD
ncbi:hypothetical protein [Chryseobacterium sp. T16E-39]|uniref:hypothetical protein n=1 Tax=Chryseobacterium sp. T16E-39 TaxID=2015076 RepID=UPI0012FCE9F7|nr:hypothetical protein [Chryseobacterium sp. T16E-39]